MVKNKKIIETIYIILAVLLTLFVLGKTIFSYDISGTNDGYLHLIKIIGVNDIIESGQFPPIIEAGFCNGYAINLFYNPLTTYISLLCGVILNNFAYGIKLMLFIMMLLAIVFMYKFIKEFTGKKEIAIAAAIFYVTNPYYLSNIYIRGAIGESAALTFLPLLFLGLHNLFSGDKKKHYYITIAAAGLILTHNITTLYAAIISLVYVLFNIKKLKEKDVVIKVLINLGFIIGITLFFMFPLVLHRFSGDYVVFNSEFMRTYGAKVSESAIELKQLFTEIEGQAVIFRFNIIQLILFIASIYCYKYIDEKNKKTYLIFIILAIICTLLSIFSSVWKIAPDILCTIQFPWRLLGFAGFFMSIVASINLFIILKNIFNGKEENLLFIIIPITLISLIYANSLDYKDYTVKKDDNESIEFVEKNIDNIVYMNINREYMPSKTYVNLNTNPNRISGASAIILEGNAEIKSENREELCYEIEFSNIDKNTKIEIPFLFYVGYNAYIEDEDNTNKIELEVKESEYGFLEIEIPNEYENARVVVEYKTPVSYYIVYVISFITLIGFIIYIVYNHKK